MMTLEMLQALRDSGEFHHATYRNQGTLWEGLHIYRRDADGFRGFSHCGMIPKDDPTLDAAYAIVRNTGVSLGAYGRG
jgi:hypothetical protein